MSSARGNGAPTDVAIRRLNAFRPIPATTASALNQALHERILRESAGQDLIVEGDRPDRIRVVLSGWLARYKTLEDGRRQIVNFILPGDTCDAFVYLLSRMDHSICSLTHSVYSEIERERFEALVAGDVDLSEAFRIESLADCAIQREWTLNIGRRIAPERVAHLLCEIFERLRPIGLVGGNSCAFPITQIDLADALGLSVVHLNRTLQELRSAGLIVLRERTLTINKLDELKSIGHFNPSYLHYAA
jgi:CRP-like cAMP-binding protein